MLLCPLSPVASIDAGIAPEYRLRSLKDYGVPVTVSVLSPD